MADLPGEESREKKDFKKRCAKGRKSCVGPSTGLERVGSGDSETENKKNAISE